jgi:hypothetical protein
MEPECLAHEEFISKKEHECFKTQNSPSFKPSTLYRMLPPVPTPSPLEPVQSFSGNEAHERPISKEISVEGTFVPPLIPQVGQLNIIGKYNHANLYPYIELLMTLRTLA